MNIGTTQRRCAAWGLFLGLALALSAGSDAKPGHVPPDWARTEAAMQASKTWWKTYRETTSARAVGIAQSDPLPRRRAAAALIVEYENVVEPAEAIPATTTGRWFAEASDAAPDDLLVAWAAHSHCRNDRYRCDRVAPRKRMIRLQPDNAAIWVAVFAEAWDRGDHAAADLALERAAAAPRYRSLHGEASEAVFAILREVPVPPLDGELRWLFGKRFGLADESVGPDVFAGDGAPRVPHTAVNASELSLHAVCKQAGESAPSAKRRDLCEAIFTRMLDSGELTSVVLAVNWLIPPGVVADIPRHTRERVREVAWLLETREPTAPAPSFAAELVRLQEGWRDGDLAGKRRRLIDRGLAPYPPADWLPKPGRFRSMITGEPMPPRRTIVI